MVSSFFVVGQNVNIPDAAFLKNLLVWTPAAGGGTIDTNGDKQISVAEAQAYTGLIIAGTAYGTISDFTGLEAFTNITSLYLYSNSVNQNLDLTNNTKLTSLTINNDEFTTIDISQLTDLETIYLNNISNLTTLDVSNNTKLKSVQIDRTSIASIDLSDLALLESFKSRLSKLTAVTFSNNPLLKIVTIREQPLVNIDVSSLSVLTGLSLLDNKLSALDVNANTNLESLYINNNQVGSLDVSMLKNLKYLDINNNNFTSIGLSKNTSLESLNVSGNNLTSLDLSKNTSLLALTVGDELNALDLSQNTALYDLVIVGGDNSNLAVVDASGLVNLGYVNITGTQKITALDFSNSTLSDGIYVLNNKALATLNIANGSNSNMPKSLDFTNNPSLSCIQIDASFNPPTTWNKDTTTNFSDNCGSLSTNNLDSNIFKLYPNPVSNILNISASQELKNIELYSVLGEKLLVSNNKTYINISSLNTGVYFVKITTSDDKFIIKKIMKN